MDEILLDLEKAFYLVSGGELIRKIRGYGEANELTVWIYDFLKDRRQRVVLRDSSSDVCKI